MTVQRSYGERPETLPALDRRLQTDIERENVVPAEPILPSELKSYQEELAMGRQRPAQSADRPAEPAVGTGTGAGAATSVGVLCGREDYPVIQVATVLAALSQDGVPIEPLLAQIGLSRAELESPLSRVSLNQVVDCFDYAARCARDPFLAYRAGQTLHVASTSTNGFTILSSANRRFTMQLMRSYDRLAALPAELQFIEQHGTGAWVITPIAHRRIDERLYRFIVELGLSIAMSLHRDVMGSSFSPLELRFSYGGGKQAAEYEGVYGAKVSFAQPRNALVFDAAWLDGKRNPAGAASARAPHPSSWGADATGVSARVRNLLLTNRMRALTCQQAARTLHMSQRTLRRKLEDEKTSFRQVLDNLRMSVAIHYLRDTELTVEGIAAELGFSDAANFRHAFRRWTKVSPHAFRSSRLGASETNAELMASAHPLKRVA